METFGMGISRLRGHKPSFRFARGGRRPFQSKIPSISARTALELIQHWTPGAAPVKGEAHSPYGEFMKRGCWKSLAAALGIEERTGGFLMRTKILAGVAAIAIAASSIAITPAEAHWHGGYGGWGHGGWGWGGAAAGFAAGALIGGAVASGPYYGPGYYYGPPAYAYAPGGPDAAYCAQRYRSYDPRSGTFLGYDGMRHPCP
jgi:hypothetical protein